ncbi:mitochondrial ribosomal large subunit protein [Scheffersomyces xylosifermentans]|uniref:mitochondrial ribosomal large subunit protein n=1 Tax=Scheffersomyces xylosifermentans TaxID=1304137 RepID=UPI00315DCFE6
MSWNTAKKRFQRDIESLPTRLREYYQRELNARYTLPTFEGAQLPTIPAPKRKTNVQKGIAPGDLVYITEGEKKGTVTSVFHYNPSNDAVLVANVTEKRITPKTTWVDNQNSHYVDYPKYIPHSSVKLAGKDRDDSGKVSYVVADEIVLKDKYYDDRYRSWLPRRFVKHHDTIEIPWPNPPTAFEDDSLSTPELAVLEKTYELQTIAKPPFPKAALDQLRNPYSRHKKRVLSELQARRLNSPEMPLSTEQKIYLAKQANKPKKVYTNLSEEIKDFIGDKIAQHVNSIKEPAMLAHLEALSKSTIPDFKKTMENIKENEKTQ